MLRFFQVIFLFCVLLLISCEAESGHQKTKPDKSKPANSDIAINRILNRGVLRAATDYGSVSYLIYRGETIGYQYELLKELTRYLGVKLEIRIEKNPEKSIQMLNKDKVDLIAMGLTVTNERKKKVLFSDPIFTSEQVLIQRLPDNFRELRTRDEIEAQLIRNQIELAGKTIYVQEGTVFPTRLKVLENEIGADINVIEDDKDVEDLIAAVSSGEIDYTIADKYIALVIARYYDNLDTQTPVSFPQQIAWAVKKGQTGLVDTINLWLEEFNNSLLSRILYKKYFENLRSGRIARSQYSSYSGGHLSPYDEEIREASEILGWDWRLLASLVYQESEFKPDVKSWVGAYGLMQMMPATFEEYGLDTTANPKQQLMAGARYLKKLNGQLPESIDERMERIKFTLAAYNCGLGHVLDARRLAKKYGMDPDKWDNNVDHFILGLSDSFYYHDTVVYYGYIRGEETYAFVNDILTRYADYRNLISE